MPRRKTHMVAGGVTGLVSSAIRSNNQPDQILEIAGGIFGGIVGGRLPDILEPALTPNHRNTAHSACAGIGVFAFAGVLAVWQHNLRERANAIAVERAACIAGSLEACFLRVVEIACRALAGFLSGLQAGYISHIALDALTPQSICFLFRSF